MKISLICLALCLSCVPRLPELEPTNAISLLDLRGQYETGVEGTIATLPLRGARVELVGVGLVTHTGDNGEFVFLQIPASALANRLEFLVFDPIALESDPPIGRFVETISDTAVGSVTFAKKIVNPRGALVGRVDLVGDENNGGVLVYAEGLPGVDDLTGPDGTFILLGIPEGAVRIHANRTGFVPTPTAVEFQAQAYARLPIEEIILLNPIPGERLTASTGGRVITADGQIPEGCEVWAIPQISGDAEIAMVRMAVSPEGRFNAPLNYDEPHQLILKSQGKLTTARLLQVQPGRQDLVLVGLPLPEGDDDRDGDGHPSSEDVDDTDPHTWADLDGDGIGDLHDWDDDGDGVSDMEELCPGRDDQTSDPQDESDGDPNALPLAGGFSRMQGGDGIFWADRNPAQSQISALLAVALETFANSLALRREQFATQGLFGPFLVTPVEGELLQFRASGYLGSADDQIELVTLKAAHCEEEGACQAAFAQRQIGAGGAWIKQYPITLEAAGRGRLKMRSDFAISEPSWVWVWLPGGAAATPLCGNSNIDAGEMCDDGNEDDDFCTSECRLPICGDGIVQRTIELREVCDDGNGDDGDACTNGCREAVCGDGVHRTDLAPGEPGYEGCDDGNEIDIDGCNSDCEIGEVQADADGDGVADEVDNCPEVSNRDQLDSDTDHMGNQCDDDDDGDGTLDTQDCAPLDPTISENCDSCGNRRVETYQLDGSQVEEVCDDGNNLDGDGCAIGCGGPANRPLAVGGTASCKITNNVLSCWGQLYNIVEGASSPEWQVPTPVANPSTGIIKQVGLGDQHGCVIANDQVYCFGAAVDGKLGIAGESTSEILRGPLTAVDEQALLNTLKIAVGKDHSCALSRAGAVFCWGNNSNSQAAPPFEGQGIPGLITRPTQVPGLSDVIDVVSGARHSCALLRSGVMKCWGDDSTMALGRPDLEGEQCDGLSDGRFVGPVLGLPDDSDVIKMAAGTNHTCALMADGALYCWGQGDLGDNAQFCDGQSPTPRRVHQTDNDDEEISRFVDVAAGNNLTCATGYIVGDVPAEPTDIDLWCWGSNARGQLGIQNGNTDFNADHPRRVAGSENGTISGLATGSGSHACSGVSNNNDEVRCWGAGTNYQLGYCQTNTDSPARLLVGSNACGG